MVSLLVQIESKCNRSGPKQTYVDEHHGLTLPAVTLKLFSVKIFKYSKPPSHSAKKLFIFMFY